MAQTRALPVMPMQGHLNSRCSMPSGKLLSPLSLDFTLVPANMGHHMEAKKLVMEPASMEPQLWRTPLQVPEFLKKLTCFPHSRGSNCFLKSRPVSESYHFGSLSPRYFDLFFMVSFPWGNNSCGFYISNWAQTIKIGMERKAQS